MRKHPSFIIEEIVKKYGTDIQFEFSHYLYIPNTIKDQRNTFTLFAEELTPIKLKELCDSTPKGTELALHSRVLIREDIIMHIPMIDLATKAVGIIGRVVDVLPSKLIDSVIWFESGRSYHGYGKILISQENWIKLMGRLLLANQPQMSSVVDPRWIGHRLIAGYSALRWTKNTEYYIQEPELVKNAYLIMRPKKENSKLLGTG